MEQKLNNQNSFLFINIYELMKLIIKSKFLIILLCFGFLTSSTIYLALKPVQYNFSVKIDLGNTIDYIKIKEVKNKMMFFFPSLGVDSFEPQYLTLNYLGSLETGRSKMNSSIENLNATFEQYFLEAKIANQKDIDKATVEKNTIINELQRRSSLESVPNNDSRKDVFMSELYIEIDFIESRIEELKNLNFQSSMQIIEKNESLVAKKYLTTGILMFFLGFIISILIILLKLVFSDLTYKKN